MRVDVVVDVGNSRIKWGRCSAESVSAMVSLSADAPDTWESQLRVWQMTGPLTWAVTSVNPATLERLTDWLHQRSDRVVVLAGPEQLPLRVMVERPERVGMDRLLNAVAARRRQPGRPVVIVDAGSAITVDLVDEAGAFRGGAILPGLRLMALALHEHTALLPLVEVRTAPPILGTSTTAAIHSGVYYGVAGAINTLADLLGAVNPAKAALFLTGGDAALLKDSVNARAILWPEMTLEGVRLSAEAQP